MRPKGVGPKGPNEVGLARGPPLMPLDNHCSCRTASTKEPLKYYPTVANARKFSKASPILFPQVTLSPKKTL